MASKLSRPKLKSKLAIIDHSEVSQPETTVFRDPSGEPIALKEEAATPETVERAAAFLAALGVSADSVQRLSREDFAKKVSSVKAAVFERITAGNPDYTKTYVAVHLPEFIDAFLNRSFSYFAFPLSDKLDYLTAGTVNSLPREQLKPLLTQIESLLTNWFNSQQPSSEKAPPSSTIEPPKTESHVERQMREQMEKSFVQDGVRWFPLSVAAPIVQAPRSTIMHWINKETKFAGEPLQTYYFAPANRHFISEDSIERAANRFIKWPSGKPAGPVTLGTTKDRSGYIRLTDAAHTIGVDHHTMWRWTTKGTAPTDQPLDVIKDPAGDQYYIHEKDVAALKKLVPRAGLRAGRRSQPTPHP